MRKALVTLAASLALAALIPAPAANATVYTFTFESFDGALSATGELTVDASDDVVSMTGSISGLVDQTISGVVDNPVFPGVALSPDGSFTFDNLFSGSDPYFDSVGGLLFSTVEAPGAYWNVWSYGPGNYGFWEAVGSGNYAIQETGRLSVTPVPELSTWAMLGLGFAGLFLAGVRRAPRLRHAIVG